MDWLIWSGALAMLGAIIGSFLATLVIRWPLDRSIARGRSECDGCGRTLAAVELVPLLSAAVQRGKCRTCALPIDPRHWQIELGAAAVGAMAGLAVPGPVALAGAVFGWLLLTLAALDATEFWLPDPLVGFLAAGGVATGVFGISPALVDRMLGGVGGFTALWLIGFGYRRLRGREGLGGGDPKLFGAIGLWLGWAMLPAVLLLAALVGLALVLIARIGGRPVRMDSAMPFGTLLAIAAYPAWLFLLGSWS